MSDATAVTDLVLRERQGRDRGWWDQMAACYSPESSVFVSWFRGSGAEFVATSRTRTAGGTNPLHRLSPPVVHSQARRAIAEVPAAIEFRTTLGGVEVDHVAYTRLLYRAERYDSAWLVRDLTAVYERDALSPTVPGHTVTLDPALLANTRSSYRYLTYLTRLRSGTPARTCTARTDPIRSRSCTRRPSTGCKPRKHAMSDISEITQLVLHERQGRDRGWWEQMLACFHPDSIVTVSWFRGDAAEFVAGSRATFQRGIRPTHRLSPPTVHLNGGSRALVELPAAIEVRDVFEGVDADLASYTRLLYRVERIDTDWKIKALTCIYERDTLVAVVPGTPINLDRERLAKFRRPYRYLAYHLSSAGHTVGQDLYGDDQPDRVNALYAETFEWLRH